MLPALMLLAATLAVLALGLVRRVPSGQVLSVRRAGRTARLLQPGVHLVLPLWERVGHRIDLSGQILRLDEALADALVGATLYWQVLDPEQAVPVMDELPRLMREDTLDALALAAPEPDADLRALGQQLKQRLNAKLRARGAMVTRVELARAA